MNNRLRFAILLNLLLVSTTFFAEAPAVTVAFTELRKPLDFTKLTVGETFDLKLLRSVFVKDVKVIPRDSLLKAHVAKVENEGKHIRVHMVLDSVKVGAADVPVQGIIVAMAPNPRHDLSDDPQFSMMRSTEPIRNDPDRSNSTESNAAVGVATKLHKEGGQPLAFNENSQGMTDIEGKLDWNLKSPPPETIVESKGKKLTLPFGTQVLIRMAQPKLP